MVRTESALVGSLDMGTTKVSAMIAERSGTGGGVRVIGIGTTGAVGLRQGVVVDIEAAARAVSRAVREAETMAGVSLRRYNVGVAGEHIRSMNSRGVVGVPSPDHEITPEDVARALEAARNFALPVDREILHTLPQQYIVDNQGGIRAPSGMYGTRLEARAHIVTASRAALDNVEKTLDSVRLEVGDMILEPLASSYAVLSEEEREIGVTLIDIGGGTTDVMIIAEEGVIASGVIGIGGSNITSDIAYGLRTAIRSAEAIKIEHGCALTSMVDSREALEVQTVGQNEVRRIGRHILSGIIEPRVTELLSLIDEQLTRNGFKQALGAGVVLTGGSSMLEGIRELAEQIFDLPVRIGMPLGVEGLSEVVGHPMHATGVGLLKYDGAAGSREPDMTGSGKWWKMSYDHLRRAIASFI